MVINGGGSEAASKTLEEGPGCLSEAVQRSVRVNVTCVTPLGEEAASTS
jgi:hypothetical protein